MPSCRLVRRRCPLAYEVARLIEANGDKVVLCASLDTVRQISESMGGDRHQPDGCADPFMSYLLDLTSKKQAMEESPVAIHQRTYEEALAYILEFTSGETPTKN